MLIVVGGNITPKLKTWLRRIDVIECNNHMKITISDISPIALYEAGEQIKHMLPPEAFLISVGELADKILTDAYIFHGALPSTSTKDELKIQKALSQCKEYLTMRRYYYDPTRSPFPSR